MVRSLTLALLGLALAGSPALAASKRDETSGPGLAARTVAPARPGAGQSGGPAAGPAASGGARAATQAAGGAAPRQAPRQAMLWQAVPARGQGAVTRDESAALAAGGGTCQRDRGAGAATRCRAQPVLGTSGWARNLPPPAGVQAEECPSGTMATLAWGHEDIIRCMPL